MATNRKKVKEYLLSCIDFDGYACEESHDPNTRILTALSICRSEIGYIEKMQGTQAMIEYWFAGLCSVVSLPFTYSEIVPLAVGWGSIPENHTELQAEKICSNWFRYLAAQFCQMIAKAERQR